MTCGTAGWRTIGPIPAGWATVNVRILLSAFLLLAALPVLASHAPAVTAASTRTWTGGDATSNAWTDPDNWDTGAPVAGDSLVFPDGAQRKANTNTFPPGTEFQDVTITGGDYEISGNPIDVLGEFLNEAPAGETNVIEIGINGPGTVTTRGGRLALLEVNGYDGGTFVSLGSTLLMADRGTLGSTAAGTTVSNGSRLQLANSVDLGDEDVLIVGAGPGGAGGLNSISGTNRSDNMSFNGDATVNVSQSTLILRDLSQAGSGALSLIGGGRLVVEGTAAGTTSAVVVHGNLTWNATTPVPVTVEKDGILRGAGTVGSIASAGGTVSPGFGQLPGRLTATSGVTLSGGVFRVAIDGPGAGTGYGQLLINGGLAIPSSLTKLELDVTTIPVAGQEYTIIDASAPISGTFFQLPEGATFNVGGYAYSITYKGGPDTNDVVLRVLRQVNANLAAAISVEPATATPGQSLMYTLTMTNNGPDAATSPRFSMGVPAGTSLVLVTAPGWSCATPGGASITCTGSTLAAGEFATIRVTVRVNDNASGSISATVATFSNTNDAQSADNSASVTTPVGTGGGPSPLPFRRFLPGVAFD